MNPHTLVDVIVFVLFALLAGWLSRRMRAPRNPWVRIGLLILLVAAPALGANLALTVLVVTIYLSVALQGFVFGLIAGWWAKR